MAKIKGSGSNDRLFGTNKADHISGRGGNDKISGDDGNDKISGGKGNDTIYGGDGNDRIDGGKGNDSVYGGDGKDILVGGAGADQLTGGGGKDIFVYADKSDSPAAGGWDRILDFTQGSDKIDLTAFRGAHNLNWSGTTAGTKHGVWYVQPEAGTSTFVYADTSGDGMADLKIELKRTSGLTLTSSDFIGVNHGPVAVHDAVTTSEDDQGTVINVLANDRGSDNDGLNGFHDHDHDGHDDCDDDDDHDDHGHRDDEGHGDKIFLTGVTNGAHGTVMINGNGTVIYTPNADFNGIDSFTYTISDGHGGTDTATVNVTVNAVVDIAGNADTTDEDTPVTTNALANDSFEGSPVVTSVTQGTNGSVVNNGDGTVTYTANADFNGADSYTYTVTSGGVIETATVNVTVNAVVDIAGDADTTNEDTAVTTDVLANDMFEDAGRELTSFTSGTNGTVTRADGGTPDDLTDDQLVYMPNANFNGDDLYTYTVTSGGVTEPTNVSVTVKSVNDAPVAVIDTFSTNVDTMLTVAAPGVLANDSDPYDTPANVLSAAVVDDVDHGTLVLNLDGSFTYTPDAGFNGADSFTYQVSDNGGTLNGGDDTGNIATVTIKVSSAPVAHDDMVLTNIASGTDILIPVAALLFNDTDSVIGPLPLSIGTVANPAMDDGVELVSENVTYTDNPPHNGPNGGSFEYTVSDGATESAFAHVTVDTQTGDTVTGTTENDILIGSANADTLLGDDGNDYLVGGAGDDTLDGGVGIDTASYANDPAGVTVDLLAATQVDGSGDSDTLISIENVTGSAFIDTLGGDEKANVLDGGADMDFLSGGLGDDTLIGGDGGDSLIGNAGNDVLNGGAGDELLLDGGPGNDVFKFLFNPSPTVTSGDGLDTIEVFEWGTDKLEFSGITEDQFRASFDVDDTSGATVITIHGDTSWSLTLSGVTGQDLEAFAADSIFS